MGRILKIVGLFIILLSLGSCKEYQEVKVSGVKDFKMKKLNADGMEAEIMLAIKNPNDFGFSIFRSEFDVTFSGIRLGKAKLYKRVHIDRNCEKTYTFLLKSSFKEVSLVELTGLVNGRRGGAMELKGDLKVGKFFYRIKYPVNFRERIDLSKGF